MAPRCPYCGEERPYMGDIIIPSMENAPVLAHGKLAKTSVAPAKNFLGRLPRSRRPANTSGGGSRKTGWAIIAAPNAAPQAASINAAKYDRGITTTGRSSVSVFIRHKKRVGVSLPSLQILFWSKLLLLQEAVDNLDCLIKVSLGHLATAR